MITKQKITKKIIIIAAFTEWSKSCFWHCSLQSVSDNLGISKTALYRHFKNKEELLSSLDQTFITSLKETVQSIKNRAPFHSFDDTVRFFIETYYQFFKKYPYYLYYLVFHYIQNNIFVPGSREDEDYRKKYKGIESLLSSILTHSSPGKEHGPDNIKILYREIIFFLPMFIENPFSPDITIDAAHNKSFSHVIYLLYRVTMNGFCDKKQLHRPDYNTVEQFFNFKEDIFSREKIVDAVFNVVSSEGLHKASISKIAEQLGIQKSSIYHYFKSKSDLIKTLVKQSGEKLNLYFKKCVSSFSRPEDRLYCLFIVTASYFYHVKPAIHLFSWLIFNKLIDKEYLKLPSLWSSERFKVFENIFNQQEMKTYDLDVKIIFSYIDFNILASIFSSGGEKVKKKEKNRIIRNIRQIYTYFLYGFSGGIDEIQ